MTATAIDALLAPLLTWRDILLVYAALLGLEAPTLLWLALWWHRPRWEWIAALAPAVGFAWTLRTARELGDVATSWHTYAVFAAAHYGPEYLPNFHAQNMSDIQAAVASAQTVGWSACAVTLALLIFGWMLVVRWQARAGRFPEAVPAVAADTTGEPSTVPVATTPDEVPDGELEITVEPLDAP
jgi:hypothetical protein